MQLRDYTKVLIRDNPHDHYYSRINVWSINPAFSKCCVVAGNLTGAVGNKGNTSKLQCEVGDNYQPCQNVPAAGNFAIFSLFLAAYSTLDFTRIPLAGKGTWCLLPYYSFYAAYCYKIF